MRRMRRLIQMPPEIWTINRSRLNHLIGQRSNANHKIQTRLQLIVPPPSRPIEGFLFYSLKPAEFFLQAFFYINLPVKSSLSNAKEPECRPNPPGTTPRPGPVQSLHRPNAQGKSSAIFLWRRPVSDAPEQLGAPARYVISLIGQSPLAGPLQPAARP